MLVMYPPISVKKMQMQVQCYEETTGIVFCVEENHVNCIGPLCDMKP